MRRLKWVLTGVVVLLVGVVVAGIAILKSIDLNQYKDLIAQEIESATGRKVVIGGPIAACLRQRDGGRLIGDVPRRSHWHGHGALD
jgi:uncharacterized protein involved in outer membrane biogenesis